MKLEWLFRIAPGLLLTAMIAEGASQAASRPSLADMALNPLGVAMLGGMLLGNTGFPRLARVCGAGVDFSRQPLLRLGVILYGLRITFSQIADFGISGIIIDALILSATFGLAVLVGGRLFGLDRETSILVGAGSAICGAAAVMATESVLRAKPENVAIAVMTVVIFGTVAMFAYPILFSLNEQWDLVHGPRRFGLYTGATVHEVAQVIAAARPMGEQAAATALIAKMVRVMMLAPFLVVLSVWISRRNAACAEERKNVLIPWFALGFITMAGIHSLQWIPENWVSTLNALDNFLLAMAMAGLGLRAHFSMIRRAGARPMGLAACLALFLVVGGWAIQGAVWAAIGGT